MKKTGIVIDDIFMTHDTGPGHPERAERIAAIRDGLSSAGLMDKLRRIDLREASREELLRVHTPEHLGAIAATAKRDQAYLDPDTPTGKDSYKAALLAAGSLLAAVDEVMSGNLDNAFAAVRPPGHHAESNRAMGFCLFNNVAVAAQYAIDRHRLERVMIVDWDVHHGNGTQRSFYKDPRVLYFSTHHYPFYPGTGGVDEIGTGEGKGYNVNVPFPAGAGDDAYDAAFARVLEPVARGFKPELILVSAGFDPHRSDPLGGMAVTDEGFVRMTGRIMKLADEFAEGKAVFTLEGGYNLGALSAGAAKVVSVMMGKTKAPEGDLAPPPGFQRLMDREKEYLSGFWPEIGG